MRTPGSEQTRAQAEAAEWLARLGNHAVSTDTVRAFREWRDDPANDAAYQEAEAFWEASGRHAADPEIMRMTEAALARRRRPRLTLSWPRRPLGWMLAVASLAVLSLGVVLLGRIAPAYTTGPAEQRVVRLADGSRVHLNVDSRLRVRFSGGERRIDLARGEAFFDVAHDPARPFLVRAGRTEVRALGTRFDVRRDGSALQVTLVQGAVRVARSGSADAWTLRPDETLRVSTSGRAERRTTDADAATSWTTGRLDFRATPLAEAVAEVNRYGERKVVLDGPGLEARRVSGHFDVGDTEAFVRGVASVFDLQVQSGPGGEIVLRAGPAAGA